MISEIIPGVSNIDCNKQPYRTNAQNLVWHKERMQAKDEEMIKFLDQDNEKQAKRKRSIATRTYHSELHKTSVNGMSYIIK